MQTGPYRITKGVALLLAGTMLASPLLAEEAAPAEEIVVTALKRGNVQLQDVPTSIAVVGQQQLEARGVAEFADFARSVAGLNFVDSGAGDKRYIIRGINAAGEAQTALYYDNIPMTGIGGAATSFGDRQPDLQLYDVQQIEVLRGPQGTLYGSNSQAGVIRFVTNKARVDRFEGSAQGELSTTRDGGTNYGIRGMVNVPIVQDVLAIRAVGYSEDYSGWVDNVYRNEKDFNDTKRDGARVSVTFKPDEQTNIVGQYFYQNLRTGGRAYTRPYDVTIGDNFFPAIGRRATSQIGRETRSDKINIFALTADRDLDWSTVTIAGSYFKRDVLDYVDNGPSFRYFEYLQRIGEFPPVTVPIGSLSYSPQKSKMWTIEARMATKFDGPLNGVGGIFYSNRDNDFETNTTVVDPISGRPDFSQPLISRRNFFDKTKDFAVFGELTYDITEQLSVTGGARWFRTKRDLVANTIVPFFGLGAPGTTSAKAKNEDVIFKGLVSYKVTSDVLLYAQYAEGYRSGGTNASSFSGVPPQYDPDTTANYEIGAKTSWAGGDVVFNVAAYRIDLKGLQSEQRFGPGGAFSGVGNIPGTAARSKGVEADLLVKPAPGLTVQFAGNYTDAKLAKDVPSLGAAALKGSNLAYVPKYNLSLSADQAFAISDKVDASVGFSASRTGKIETTYYTEFNQPSRGYTLVDTRARISWDQFKLDLFINNLFDKAAELTVFNTINDPHVVLANRPRTVGARLGIDF
ncbi:TonB-dependent receptor [Rhizorhabdus wittichii]|jgi:outer membrane receptor protein involved in Fe transport|uniref:TonB-dependent receptor n=2 Tax=Rhizorhabdus wittichii TaxID=160791 RepID=A0A9J9HFI6_RHIWR|nr:TonB-dependent receptor [Rhizorhabdus wittichii]ABQ70642.1 TonB-dependent receptor [Rhizorhabdus wittichii RW1]QTH23845.1 TonB-dependent receptor [Rhizorhabdus wittichii]